MMLDRALEEALEEVVREAGQPETVARRLTAWLRQMSEGALGQGRRRQISDGGCDELDLGVDDAD